jgi:uncharacterized protein
MALNGRCKTEQKFRRVASCSIRGAYLRMRISLFLLAVSAVFLAIPAGAASFNCAGARAADERAICASRVLSELDVEMAVRFETLAGLVPMGTRGNMDDEQRAFLAACKRCGSGVPCITALYRRRIAALKSEYQTLKQRGPF